MVTESSASETRVRLSDAPGLHSASAPMVAVVGVRLIDVDRPGVGAVTAMAATPAAASVSPAVETVGVGAATAMGAVAGVRSRAVETVGAAAAAAIWATPAEAATLAWIPAGAIPIDAT